jgi:uncharacterized protein YpmB
LDVSALFAIVVYIFVAWGFSALLSYVQSKIDLSKETQQKAIDDTRRQKSLANTQTARAQRTPRRA